MLWEDGNVEFNGRALRAGEAAACNVRGTCLCKPLADGADELQVVGSADA